MNKSFIFLLINILFMPIFGARYADLFDVIDNPVQLESNAKRLQAKVPGAKIQKYLKKIKAPKYYKLGIQTYTLCFLKNKICY